MDSVFHVFLHLHRRRTQYRNFCEHILQKKRKGYKVYSSKKHFEHNIYMAEIANCIINDGIPLKDMAQIIFSENAEYQLGVKEIIGLYLLIPYINDKANRLAYDKDHEQISIYKENEIVFYDICGNAITMKNLRNTICHSFVSCDLQNRKDPVLVFDDRSIMSPKAHHKLDNTLNGAKCVLVRRDDVLKFLKKSFTRILTAYESEKRQHCSG